MRTKTSKAYSPTHIMAMFFVGVCLYGLSALSVAPAVGQHLYASRASLEGRSGTYSPTLAALERVAPALNETITVRMNGVKLEQALLEIAARAGMKLSYSRDVVSVDRLISLELEQTTVLGALQEVIRGTDLKLKVSKGGHLVVVKRLAMELRGLANDVVHLQEGTIAGRVTDARTGGPLIGVNVIVRELTLGAATDESGRYRIPDVPEGAYTLEARYIGYRTATRSVRVTMDETTVADFALEESALNLDEVVVSVSARESRRVEIGTDVERFNAAREVDQAAIANLSDLLNSRATGVSINESSGSAGTASQIRIRGATSLTQDNNPIIYVDGIRVSNNTGSGPGSHDFGNGQTISRLDDINPQDVASIQIMKGPTAAALYGSEAAAGVILIETKQGIPGVHRFTFSTEQGFNEEYTDYPDNYYNVTQANPEFTDPNDARLDQWRTGENPVTGDVFALHNPLLNDNTSPFRTGYLSNYSLSAQGGTQDVNYYSSLRYENQEGTLNNNTLERYSLRANVNVRPSETLNLSLNTGFVGSDIRLPDNDRSSLAMHGNGLSGIPVTSYGMRSDGSVGDCLATVVLGQNGSVCESKKGNQHNTFEKLETVRNEQELGRFIGSLTAHWTPSGWFSNRVAAGIDYIQTKNMNLVPLDPDRPFGDDSKGLIDDRRLTTQILTFDYAGTATWNPAGGLSASTTVGAQYFGNRTELVACRGEGGFASTTAIACDASLIFSGSSDIIENVEIGAFLQQQLAFRDYLFATGAVRIDDNSAFGENQGAIWSPSANVSAVVSSMPFWNLDTVNNLRLRFAWGTAAQAPDPFAAARTFRPVRLEVEGTQVTGISPLAPGNQDLAAERNEEFELGFDGGILNDRLVFKFTYYNQKTTDAIVQKSVAPSTGFSGSRFVNIGAVENKGVEGLLSARILERPNFSWDVDFKFSTQDPVVTSLGGELPIMFGLGPDFQMIREGFAPGALWGVVVEEAERDANGNIIPESVVLQEGNVNDPNFPNQVYLGRPSPSNEQSLALTFTLFKNLRLYTLFDRAGGFSKYDLSGNFSTARQTTRQWAFRQSDLTPEEQAMLERGFAGAIPFFISDATFVKWRELTASYRIPTRLLNRFGGPVQSASLTLGIRNLKTWTDYEGIDPEGSFDGGSDSLQVGEFRSAGPVRTYFTRLTFTF